MKKYVTYSCLNAASFFLLLLYLFAGRTVREITNATYQVPYALAVLSLVIILLMGVSLAAQQRCLRDVPRKQAAVLQSVFAALWAVSAFCLLPVYRNSTMLLLQILTVGHHLGGLITIIPMKKEGNGV